MASLCALAQTLTYVAETRSMLEKNNIIALNFRHDKLFCVVQTQTHVEENQF